MTAEGQDIASPSILGENLSNYDEKERFLNDIFKRINPFLCNILKGIVVVLADKNNPDRYYQAANSIRGISAILSRPVTAKLRKSKDEARLGGALTEINTLIQAVLPLVPVCQSDERTGVEVIRGEAKKFIDMLKDGKFAFKQKLFSFYGGIHNVINMPKSVREHAVNTITLWNKHHNETFTSGVHYPEGGINEAEFMQQWDELKMCWINALSGFYEKDLPLLEKVMDKDVPPSE